MKRYSIAMIAPCPFPANYGTPGAIREMCEALSARGHRIHVVTYCAPQKFCTAVLRPRNPVCGELLLVARLNNLPTHEKRPKAYAEPKAAGLGGEGG